MENLRKWRKVLMSKAERVHGRILCDVRCTWQSADDKYRRRRSAIAVRRARDYSGKKGETSANLTRDDYKQW